MLTFLYKIFKKNGNYITNQNIFKILFSNLIKF